MQTPPKPTTTTTTTPMTRAERSAAAKLAAKKVAEERHAKKLHAIGARRAKQRGMSKQDYIAEIVKGKYPPITAEDIANEPDPE
jgi:hypothetical protein